MQPLAGQRRHGVQRPQEGRPVLLAVQPGEEQRQPVRGRRSCAPPAAGRWRWGTPPLPGCAGAAPRPAARSRSAPRARRGNCARPRAASPAGSPDGRRTRTAPASRARSARAAAPGPRSPASTGRWKMNSRAASVCVPAAANAGRAAPPRRSPPGWLPAPAWAAPPAHGSPRRHGRAWSSAGAAAPAPAGRRARHAAAAARGCGSPRGRCPAPPAPAPWPARRRRRPRASKMRGGTSSGTSPAAVRARCVVSQVNQRRWVRSNRPDRLVVPGAAQQPLGEAPVLGVGHADQHQPVLGPARRHGGAAGPRGRAGAPARRHR